MIIIFSVYVYTFLSGEGASRRMSVIFCNKCDARNICFNGVWPPADSNISLSDKYVNIGCILQNVAGDLRHFKYKIQRTTSEAICELAYYHTNRFITLPH